jgi:hypothetical protein
MRSSSRITPTIAAFGVLTVHPRSELNQAMLVAFDEHPSSRLVIKLCVFADEGTTAERASNRVVVLGRPMYAPWAQLQCVAKILQWLRYALDAYGSSSFVGWMDSDTWLQPRRLAAYLHGVQNALPPGALCWGGLFEHWERLETNGSLAAVGFACKAIATRTAISRFHFNWM